MKIFKSGICEYFNKLPLAEAVDAYSRIEGTLSDNARIKVLESLALRKTIELDKQGKVMTLDQAAEKLRERYEKGYYDEDKKD